MLFTPVLLTTLLGFAAACEHLLLEGVLRNMFQNPSQYPVGGSVTDATLITGNVDLVTLNAPFTLFGNSFQQLTISDKGGVFTGDVTGAIPDISGYTGGNQGGNQGFFAPIWYQNGLTEGQHEVKHYTRDSQWDPVTGNMIGAYICMFESVEERLYAYYEQKQVVEELVEVTWKLTDAGGTVYTQLHLARTTNDDTFAIMSYEGGTTAVGQYFLVNGIYGNAPSAPEYNTICVANQGDPAEYVLDGYSNLFCGIANSVVFSLAADEACTGDYATICDLALLSADIKSRPKGCTALIQPADSCYVHGYCDWVDEAAGTYFFNFTIDNVALDPRFDSIAIANDDSGTLTGLYCIFETFDNSSGFVNIATEITNDYCGAMVAGDERIVRIIVFHSAERKTTTPSFWEFEVLKQGYKMFNISCFPSSLPKTIALDHTVPDGIHTTGITGFAPTLDFYVANMWTYGAPGWMPFNNLKVDIGTPIFLTACFNPGLPFTANAHFYGISANSCMVANTDQFDNYYRPLIDEDGCTSTNSGAFALQDNFRYTGDPELIVFGDLFCITTGAMRAARWITHPNIHFKCTFRMCRNTAFFNTSSCYDSCLYPDTDWTVRKRRDVVDDDSDVVTMTATVTVIDYAEDAQASCVNETLAYSALAVLVAILLVAISIAVLLFAKQRSLQRRKQ